MNYELLDTFQQEISDALHTFQRERSKQTTVLSDLRKELQSLQRSDMESSQQTRLRTTKYQETVGGDNKEKIEGACSPLLATLRTRTDKGIAKTEYNVKGDPKNTQQPNKDYCKQ